VSLSRRGFLTQGAAATLLAPAARGAGAGELVFVCLAGGADALSLLVPHSEPHYYRARPTLALPPPGRGAGAALPLDARFGLHPRLPSLKRWFDAGALGIVAGVGSPAAVHGHRRARQALELAVLGSVNGAAPERRQGPLEVELPALAERVRRGTAPPATWLESAGWDTHVAQGDAVSGRLALLAHELDRALSAFVAGCGNALARVRLIVVSEFGRGVAETQLGGTDDGNALALWVLDGRRGLGRIAGSFGSLSPAALSESSAIRATRDLGSTLTELARGEFPS
jgi:uncharacterized protein (DUF1501 family)